MIYYPRNFGSLVVAICLCLHVCVYMQDVNARTCVARKVLFAFVYLGVVCLKVDVLCAYVHVISHMCQLMRCINKCFQDTLRS